MKVKTLPDGLLVIGGGLAGCEAALQAADRGVKVTLFEMKPHRMSAAHTSPLLGELVCSNSLRASSRESAVGLLKEEMRRLGSLIMEAADATQVPAGKSLAVDRESFSRFITRRVEEHPNIALVRQEVSDVDPERPTVVATGPLSSDAAAAAVARLTEPSALSFYDAVSPIVYTDSVDFTVVFSASRYEDGEGDYLNCPMTEEEYRAFYEALTSARQVPLKEFEKQAYFEGCLPIEIMAERGFQTLLFGPMKPVGLRDPRTGRRPFAVVQLRRDNHEGTLYNMVGFQTKLAYGEQERVFRMIPGLANARFARLGSVHRNTFVNGPRWLTPHLALKHLPNVILAGQLTGVEGYVESAAMGLLAGINGACLVLGLPPVAPPRETGLGALIHHLTTEQKDFQPSNVTFGLFPPLEGKVHKKERKRAMAERALSSLDSWIRTL